MGASMTTYMRRSQTKFATAAIAFAVVCMGAPATATAGKGGPPSTEHGVNRAKLSKKAISVIESRNGIDVLKISKCGPVKRKGKLNFSRWICLWRAEGIYPGQVPYACAGKASWRRKGKRWIVEPCNNTMQPQAPLLDVPNPHPVFGFNEDWIFVSNAAIDRLDETASTVARTGLTWAGVEGTQGSYNWYGVDQLYAKLSARGIKPLWSILSAPCWAQPDPGACNGGDNQIRPAQSHYDEMAAFAVAVAQRYPESAGIEVWNEPNYPRFWGGWPEPDLYAKMLKEVAGALHKEVPGMPVISGGLSPHSDSDTHAIGFTNFLERLYELGAAQEADAIGIHPYPGVGPNEDYVADVRVYLGKIQDVMSKYGDSSTPMWATEFGVSTTGEHAFDPSQQGTALAEIYDVLRRVNRVDVAIVHRFIEQPDLVGREAGFGVVGQSLAPKPIFCEIFAMRELAPDGPC